MSNRIFAGHRVKALRVQIGLTQAAMARKLGISVSYLSQVENGDRPLTPLIQIALRREFHGHWDTASDDETTALMAAVLDAFSDPDLAATSADKEMIRRAVKRQPLLARQLVATRAAYLRSQEELRALDDRLDSGSSEFGALPWEEARDWFHAEGNYFDGLDRAAEGLAEALGNAVTLRGIEHRLLNRFGVTVEALAQGELTRRFDPDRRVLAIDASQGPESTLFAAAHELGRLEFRDLIEERVAAANVRSDNARALLAAGLANYAAGSILMPYERFRESARDFRHDIDRLRRKFGTSFEQTCHRLSTLQRPGAAGTPFFFCRVDMAGNITKRHSATRLQFARFGGACPLWIVHEAVAIPDRILTQLAETPDGVRYVSMAKGLVKPSGSYQRAPRRYAVALGCEISHAHNFVYADDLPLDGAAMPIGTSCRICPRTDCDQRAFPPAASRIEIDPSFRGPVPYSFR